VLLVAVVEMETEGDGQVGETVHGRREHGRRRVLETAQQEAETAELQQHLTTQLTTPEQTTTGDVSLLIIIIIIR